MYRWCTLWSVCLLCVVSYWRYSYYTTNTSILQKLPLHCRPAPILIPVVDRVRFIAVLSVCIAASRSIVRTYICLYSCIVHTVHPVQSRRLIAPSTTTLLLQLQLHIHRRSRPPPITHHQPPTTHHRTTDTLRRQSFSAQYRELRVQPNLHSCISSAYPSCISCNIHWSISTGRPRSEPAFVCVRRTEELFYIHTADQNRRVQRLYIPSYPQNVSPPSHKKARYTPRLGTRDSILHTPDSRLQTPDSKLGTPYFPQQTQSISLVVPSKSSTLPQAVSGQAVE